MRLETPPEQVMHTTRAFPGCHNPISRLGNHGKKDIWRTHSYVTKDPEKILVDPARTKFILITCFYRLRQSVMNSKPPSAIDCPANSVNIDC